MKSETLLKMSFSESALRGDGTKKEIDYQVSYAYSVPVKLSRSGQPAENVVYLFARLIAIFTQP